MRVSQNGGPFVKMKMKKTQLCTAAALLTGVLAVGTAALPASAAAAFPEIGGMIPQLNGAESGRVSVKGGQTLPSFTGIRQTGQTKNSASVSWNAVSGASYYTCYYKFYDSAGQEVNQGQQTVTNPSIHLVGIPTGGMYILYMQAVDHVGNYNEIGEFRGVPSLPKLRTIAYWKPFAASSRLRVAWAPNSYANQYTAVLYKKSGKKVQTVTVKSGQKCIAYFSKSNTSTCYTVKITPKAAGSGLSVAGSSASFYAVPQPKFTSTKKDVHKNRVALRWKKVSGASRYMVYVSPQKTRRSSISGMKFKKVATVKGNRYNLKKYKGKTINTQNRYYYIKVVAVSKYGRKTVKSGSGYYVVAYMKKR
jgi:hypothetical protein